MEGLWGVKYGNENVVSTSAKENFGHKGKASKGRSLTTYQNKLQKIKSYYNRMVKESKKAKEKVKTPKHKKGVFFCDKYSTLEKYMKVLNIKEATK